MAGPWEGAATPQRTGLSSSGAATQFSSGQRHLLPASSFPTWAPGRHDREGMGRPGRYCRRRVSAGRLGERLGRLGLRPGARPLDGVVPVGRRAARRPPGPPTRHPRQGHGRLAARLCRGPGQLCRRRQPLAETLTRCYDCPNPASPAPADDASSAFPGTPATGSGRNATSARGT